MPLPPLRTVAVCLVSFVFGVVISLSFARPATPAAPIIEVPRTLPPSTTAPPLPECPQKTCPQAPPALCATKPLPAVPCACNLTTGMDLMEKGRPVQTPGMKMAMVVPFRDREAHLQVFSHFMQAFFKDYITFRMFIIEQVDGQPFNRAMLMNIGYDVSKDDYHYFCFHDVDLLPAEPIVDYTYPSDGPRHLTVNLQNFKWTTPSRTILGGITCVTKEHLILMNGWSNEFWGWGAEDEDAYRRTTYAGIAVFHPDRAVYWKLAHEHGRHQWDDWLYKYNLDTLGKGPGMWKLSGINTLEGRYKVVKRDQNELYDRVTVALDWARVKKAIGYAGKVY